MKTIIWLGYCIPWEIRFKQKLQILLILLLKNNGFYQKQFSTIKMLKKLLAKIVLSEEIDPWSLFWSIGLTTSSQLFVSMIILCWRRKRPLEESSKPSRPKHGQWPYTWYSLRWALIFRSLQEKKVGNWVSMGHSTHSLFTFILSVTRFTADYCLTIDEIRLHHFCPGLKKSWLREKRKIPSSRR